MGGLAVLFVSAGWVSAAMLVTVFTIVLPSLHAAYQHSALTGIDDQDKELGLRAAAVDLCMTLVDVIPSENERVIQICGILFRAWLINYRAAGKASDRYLRQAFHKRLIRHWFTNLTLELDVDEEHAQQLLEWNNEEESEELLFHLRCIKRAQDDRIYSAVWDERQLDIEETRAWRAARNATSDSDY
jgi:hypothetical protein